MIYTCNNCGSEMTFLKNDICSYLKLQCEKCSITLFSPPKPIFDIDFVYYQYYINGKLIDLVSCSNHTGDFKMKTEIFSHLTSVRSCKFQIFLAPNIIDNIVFVKEFVERVKMLSVLL